MLNCILQAFLCDGGDCSPEQEDLRVALLQAFLRSSGVVLDVYSVCVCYIYIYVNIHMGCIFAGLTLELIENTCSLTLSLNSSYIELFAALVRALGLGVWGLP